MTRAGSDEACAERISGPYAGFYVAAYAADSGSAFYGYAKICVGRPQDVWDCTAFDKVTTPPMESQDGALLCAEQRARDLLRALSRAAHPVPAWAELAARQNRRMRARAMFPASPANWLRMLCAALFLLVAFAMVDGMACSAYALWAPAAEPVPSGRLYAPAVFVDGKLCTGDGACAPAVLVEGVLSTDTLAQLQARARKAMPGTLTACFNSPGGTYQAASLAGSLPANLRTCVADVLEEGAATPVHALCASACAWTWMAGNGRVIYGDNSVGFHAPYEYDAPACVPGNRFKGLLSAVTGWWSDRAEPRYGPQMRAARNELRLASLTMGPTEVLPIRAARAVSLGLQRAREPAATFYAAAQAQAVTTR